MKITSLEYSYLTSFLIRSLFFGPAIYSILHFALQDGWISIIISFILSFIPLIIYYKLLNHNPHDNIVSINNKLGTLGKLINILLILFVLFHAGLILWNLTNFIYSQFLFQTPLLVISIVLAISIFYVSIQNLATIARTGTVFFIISTILFFIAAFSLAGECDLNSLKPVLNSGLSPILKGSFASLGLNIFPIFIILIIPKNDIKNNNKLLSSFFKVYIFRFICMLAVLIICISILGIELTNLYQYPEYHILKTINIANFFQRVESILSIQWIFEAVMAIALCLYYVKESITKTFNFKNKFNLINIVSLISVLLIAKYVFTNNTIAESFYKNIYPFLTLIFFLIIPFLVLIVTKFKKNKY